MMGAYSHHPRAHVPLDDSAMPDRGVITDLYRAYFTAKGPLLDGGEGQSGRGCHILPGAGVSCGEPVDRV